MSESSTITTPQQPSPPTAKAHQDRPFFGMSCALGAFFLFAMMNVFAKILSEDMHVVEIAFYRNFIAVIPFLVMIYVMGRREILTIKSSPKSIIIRSILGTLSLGVTFAAFSVMPLADVTAFLFTSSLIVPALGFFFLQEKVGRVRWAAILIGFIGVLIMIRPTGDMNALGVSLAISAACLHATLQTILRALGKTETPQTVTFYFLFIGTFVSLIPMPLFFTMPTWHHVPFILGVGVTGLLAQLLLSNAYKNAQVSTVTVFNYSGIIWAALFGWLFWNDWPSIYIWIGGSIVIASNIFIVMREQYLARKHKIQQRKALIP